MSKESFGGLGENFGKLKKQLFFGVMMLFSVAVHSQEISSILQLHRPYRIGFSGTERTDDDALQVNIACIWKQQGIKGYYEGTLDRQGKRRHEVGVLQNIVSGGIGDFKTGIIFFSGAPRKLETVGVAQFAIHTGKHTLGAEYFGIFNTQTNTLVHFPGVSYGYEDDKLGVNLKQSVFLAKDAEDPEKEEVSVLALPLRMKLTRKVSDLLTIVLDGAIDFQNIQEPLLSIAMKGKL